MPDQTLETAGATCGDCGQNMLLAEGCTRDYVYIAGTTERAARIPYGAETRFKNVPPRCHDCGTSVGHFHHHGCDMEECPTCSDQLLSCGH